MQASKSSIWTRVTMSISYNDNHSTTNFICKSKIKLVTIVEDNPTATIGLMSRVLSNGSEDRVSIPGRIIPNTQKMVPDATFLTTNNN